MTDSVLSGHVDKHQKTHVDPQREDALEKKGRKRRVAVLSRFYSSFAVLCGPLKVRCVVVGDNACTAARPRGRLDRQDRRIQALRARDRQLRRCLQGAPLLQTTIEGADSAPAVLMCDLHPACVVAPERDLPVRMQAGRRSSLKQCSDARGKLIRQDAGW